MKTTVCTCVCAAICLTSIVGCSTTAHAPQAVVPQWVYAGPAIVLRRPGHEAGALDHDRQGDPTMARGNEGPAPTDRSAALHDPVSAAAVLRYFNAKRAEVGLPAMREDADVRAAAIAHARYLQANHTFGHIEMPGAPGFTGTEVTARVQRLRTVAGASEVVSMQSNGRPESEAVTQLFASPYHRGVILFDWLSAGAAVSHDTHDMHDIQHARDTTDLNVGRRIAAGTTMTETTDATATALTVVDFADFGQAIASNELIAYPFDGQLDVPLAWTDDELPDPMGDDAAYRGRAVGYPITLSGGPNAHLVLQRLDVRDNAGRAVRCHIAALTAGDNLRNTAICTPLEPLRAQTGYTVHAIGTLTEGRYIVDVPFDLSWRFRTEGHSSEGDDD